MTTDVKHREVRWYRRYDRQHVLGIVFICIAVLMVAQGLWIQYTRDAELECQADYNQQVSEVVAQRGEWADEDRKALNTMIFSVVDPKVDDTDREAAVQNYVKVSKKNDKNRKANPLPKKTNCGG